MQRSAPALPGQLPGICNRLTGYRLFDTRAAAPLVARRIEQGFRVAEQIRRHSPLDGRREEGLIFEAGTGQNAVVPVLLWCLGCSRHTVTVDLVRNLNPWFIALQLDYYRAHRQCLFGHLKSEPREYAKGVAERLDRLLSLPGKTPYALTKQVLELCNITYIAPADAGKIALPASSFDIFLSTNFLEHIARDELPHVLRHGGHLLKPGGLSVHLIDNSDHNAHECSGVSRFSFLRFDDAEWLRMDYSQTKNTNRLRSSEYLPIFESAGFNELETQATIDYEARDAIDAGTLPLSPRFQNMVADDLATRTTLITSRKPTP